jgi:uncharacterized membrane protein YeaQ/YmgE (transglycosylase-associated protein family)
LPRFHSSSSTAFVSAFFHGSSVAAALVVCHSSTGHSFSTWEEKTMMELIGLAIFGLVVGVIAKLIMPGKDPGGIIVTAIIGMAGSLIGTFIGRTLLGQGRYYQAKWIMSILGALILLGLYRMIAGRRV